MTNNIIKVLNDILFYAVVIRKWFAILFRRERQLQIVDLSYYRNWHSDRSYLVVHILCNNAIFFKIGSYKCCDFTRPLVLNVTKFSSKSVCVKIYGFGQVDLCEIKLNREIQINFNSFSTSILNWNDLFICDVKPKFIKHFQELHHIGQSYGHLEVGFQANFVPIQSKILYNSLPIQIKFNPFKSEEFL